MQKTSQTRRDKNEVDSRIDNIAHHVGYRLSGLPAGPPEDHSRDAYRLLLSQVDANKDGILSVAECMSIYTTQSMAEKNCTFWDADKDGLIKEDEYVKQVQSLGKKEILESPQSAAS